MLPWNKLRGGEEIDGALSLLRAILRKAVCWISGKLTTSGQERRQHTVDYFWSRGSFCPNLGETLTTSCRNGSVKGMNIRTVLKNINACVLGHGVARGNDEMRVV
jgi:hypothetical protein